MRTDRPKLKPVPARPNNSTHSSFLLARARKNEVDGSIVVVCALRVSLRAWGMVKDSLDQYYTKMGVIMNVYTRDCSVMDNLTVIK